MGHCQKRDIQIAPPGSLRPPLARRALIISRLAQEISERNVQGGLPRVLLTQAKRLQ